MSAWWGPAALCAAVALGGLAHAGPRVFSLDQCADQYVLALSPRADIVALSPRALNADSFLAQAARGLPRRRATLEAILATRPDVVVRLWGGDPRLTAALARRGVRVVTLDDAADFAGVRADIRRAAAALRAAPAGERLIAQMDARLRAARGAWGGQDALYLTSGGATSGSGTLIDASLAAAGLRNAAGGVGYRAVPMERLLLHPPRAVVAGFFDVRSDAVQRWSLARRRPVAELVRDRALVSLPSSLLACPAWFSARAVTAIARARP